MCNKHKPYGTDGWLRWLVPSYPPTKVTNVYLLLNIIVSTGIVNEVRGNATGLDPPEEGETVDATQQMNEVRENATGWDDNVESKCPHLSGSDCLLVCVPCTIRPRAQLYLDFFFFFFRPGSIRSQKVKNFLSFLYTI